MNDPNETTTTPEPTPEPTTDERIAALRAKVRAWFQHDGKELSDDELALMALETLDTELARQDLAALVVWVPQIGAYRLGDSARLIAAITVQVPRKAPDPDFPIEWQISQSPAGPLEEHERVALAEFLVARLRAWVDRYKYQRLAGPAKPSLIIPGRS